MNCGGMRDKRGLPDGAFPLSQNRTRSVDLFLGPLCSAALFGVVCGFSGCDPSGFGDLAAASQRERGSGNVVGDATTGGDVGSCADGYRSDER